MSDRRKTATPAALAIVLALVACLLLAACGGSGGSSSSGGSTGAGGESSGSGGEAAAGLTTVDVNLIPIANAAPIYLGIKQGFFKKHGLELKITQSLSGGPTIIPALVSGQDQFGSPAYSDLVLAVSKGFPLVSIGPGDSNGNTNATDYQAILVSKDSGIKSASELEGKTIAINSLKGLGEVEVDATLEAAGVDPSSVHYVAINFPDQLTALKAGRVDAVWETEPFLSVAASEGETTNIGGTDFHVAENLPISTWLTSTKYLEEHPETVRAFQLALKESLAYAQANQAEAREIIPTFTQIPAAAAEHMILPTWVTEQDPAAIEKLVKAMKKYEIIENEPTIEELITPFPIEE